MPKQRKKEVGVCQPLLQCCPKKILIVVIHGRFSMDKGLKHRLEGGYETIEFSPGDP
jgi:hypothetical protein